MPRALCVLWLQEDDVIGLLPGGDDIAKLQPLQVGRRRAAQWVVGQQPAVACMRASMPVHVAACQGCVFCELHRCVAVTVLVSTAVLLAPAHFTEGCRRGS